MLGLKHFKSATVTISGIELVQKIQKHHDYKNRNTDRTPRSDVDSGKEMTLSRIGLAVHFRWLCVRGGCGG
jgi:hypothetical protein